MINNTSNVVNKRNTVQRQLIVNAVKELNIHATAEQVFEHIVKTHPSVSKATVYRNLNQMAESGELLNIGSFYGSVHYDHNCHEHYHFICGECKRIFDVKGEFFEIISDKIKERNKTNAIGETDEFEITNCHISFSGLCRECKSLFKISTNCRDDRLGRP